MASTSQENKRKNRPMFESAPVAVREDIKEVHEYCWRKLAEPGNWWTGAERIAIAAEVRKARACQLCKDRLAALSPVGVQGEHDSEGTLPELLVEMIHRVVTDPSRLSQSWYEQTIAAGLAETHYVEALAIVARTSLIDTFCRGIGSELHELPEPLDGGPSQRRPAQAQTGEGAWVPMIPNGKPIDEPDADLYQGLEEAPNVLRALSLVPEELRTCLNVLMEPHYMDPFKVHYVLDPTLPDATPERAISRAQMEFLGSRVSALNQCFY